MQVAEENMVRDEYPVPEGEEAENEKDIIQEMAQRQENNYEDADQEMESADNEEYSNDIDRCFGDDVYSADIGIKALEDELDHLQTALDHLEKKNDDIHAELIDLLQSNREVRKQFQESVQQCKEGHQSK